MPLELGETKHSFEITADGMGVIWYVNGIPHKETTHARGGSWSSTWNDGLKDPSRHHLNQNGLRGVIRKSFMNHCIIGGRAMYGNLFVEDTCPGTEVSHFAVKTAVHNWLHAKFFNNDQYAFNYGSRGVQGADDNDFNSTSITNEQDRFRINNGNIWVGPNCTYNADLCRWSLQNSNNGLVVIDNYLNASDTEFSISYLNYCNNRTSGVNWNGGVQFLSASSAFNNNGLRLQLHMRGNNGYMNMITPLYLESIEGNYATNGYSANYLFGYRGSDGSPWIGTHQGNNTYYNNSTWNTGQIPLRNGEEHLVFTFKVESDGYVRIQVYRKDELRFYARFLPSVNSSTGKRYTLKDMVGKCLIGKSHYSSGHGASYNTDGSQIYDIRVINKALNLSEIKSMYPRIFDIYAHTSHSTNSDGFSCRSIAQTGNLNHFMKYGGIVGGHTAAGTSQWNTDFYSFGSNTKILKDEIEFFIPSFYTSLSIGIDSEPHKNWGSSQGMDQRIKDATKDLYGFHQDHNGHLFIYGSGQDNGSGVVNGYGTTYTVAWANPTTLNSAQRHLKIKMNKRISKIEFARLDGFRAPYTKLPKDFGTIIYGGMKEDVNYLGYDSSDGNFIVATDGTITNNYWQNNYFGTDIPESYGVIVSNDGQTGLDYWAYDPSDTTVIGVFIDTSYHNFHKMVKWDLNGSYVNNSSKYQWAGALNVPYNPTIASQSDLINYYNTNTSVPSVQYSFTKGASFPNLSYTSKMCKIDLDGSYIDNSCRIGDIVDITNESELKDVYDNATNASNDFTFETGVNYSFLPENSEEAKIEMYVDNHLMKTFTPKNKTGIWYLGGLINRRKDNDGPAVYISSPELPTYGKIGEFS